MIILAYADLSLEPALEVAGMPYRFVRNIPDIIAYARHHFPAVILLEARLDNGWRELMYTLRQDIALMHLPVLAITPPELRPQVVEAGARELLSVPLEPVELRVRVQNIGRTDLTGSLDVLAHDLHNPIGITAFSLDLALEIMGDDLGVPELQQLINNVLLSNFRLQFMVEDTLDFFRLQAGLFEINPVPVDVKTTVLAATDKISRVAEQNKITIEVEVPANLPLPVADQRLFQRAINAGIDTAIKFCQPNTRIQIKVTSDAKGVAVNIIDPGQPVRAGYTPQQLFDLAHISRAREAGSRSAVALSLPFCYAAMAKMGGIASLNTDSRTGLTTLALWLPVEPGT